MTNIKDGGYRGSEDPGRPDMLTEPQTLTYAQMREVPPPGVSSDAPYGSQPTRICECCERELAIDETLDWIFSRQGEWFCADCGESLVEEGKRMIAALPARVGLCPDPNDAAEFYYPFSEQEIVTRSLGCPSPHCNFDLVMYYKQPTAEQFAAAAEALREAGNTYMPDPVEWVRIVAEKLGIEVR